MSHSMVGSMAGGPAYYRDAAVRGNTYQRQYVCKTLEGLPINLTGYVMRWRGVYGDLTLSKSTADGSMLMTTPSNGTALLTLTPEETRAIPAEENMKYELEVISPVGEQQTVLWGDLVGKGGVTFD